MRTIKHTAAAGSTVKFHEVAKHFNLLETTAPVDVSFFKNGAIFAKAEGMEGGFFSQPPEGYDAVEITSVTAQSIKFAVSDGTGGTSRVTGAVQVQGTVQVAGDTQTRFNLISQSVIWIPFADPYAGGIVQPAFVAVLANPNRRYLLIHNVDNVACHFGLVSAANGGQANIYLPAKGTFIMDSAVYTGEITASTLNNVLLNGIGYGRILVLQ